MEKQEKKAEDKHIYCKRFIRCANIFFRVEKQKRNTRLS